MQIQMVVVQMYLMKMDGEYLTKILRVVVVVIVHLMHLNATVPAVTPTIWTRIILKIYKLPLKIPCRLAGDEICF